MTPRVKLAFYPNQANPARTSGKGVYRVVRTYEAEKLQGGLIAVFPATDGKAPTGSYLYLAADREYKVGSRVDPRKIALAYLAQRATAVLDEYYGRLEREHLGDPVARTGIYGYHDQAVARMFREGGRQQVHYVEVDPRTVDRIAALKAA